MKYNIKTRKKKLKIRKGYGTDRHKDTKIDKLMISKRERQSDRKTKRQRDKHIETEQRQK